MNLISCIIFCSVSTSPNDSCDLNTSNGVLKGLVKKDKALMRNFSDKHVKETDLGIWIKPILVKEDYNCIGLYSYKLSGSYTYYNRFFLYKVDKKFILNQNKLDEIFNKDIERMLKKVKIF